MISSDCRHSYLVKQSKIHQLTFFFKRNGRREKKNRRAAGERVNPIIKHPPPPIFISTYDRPDQGYNYVFKIVLW